MYVTNIVNDLKKKKEELHGDVDSELYLLDPEFYILCKLFSEKTGKSVDYKKYTDDCKQKDDDDNMIEENKQIDYIRSVHYGYSSKDKKNGLIYCGRTFVPKNCLVYLRCGLVSGLPCKDCIKRLENELENVYVKTDEVRQSKKKKGGSDNDEGKEVKVLSLFKICKEEINERDKLGRALLRKYKNNINNNDNDNDNNNNNNKEANAKKYTALLKKASWVPSIKNLLLGGIQCDMCSTRYYSQYMPFLCMRVGISVDGSKSNSDPKLFTAKICAKCAVDFMCKNGKGSKDIADVELIDKKEKGESGNKDEVKYKTRLGYKSGKYIYV